jgi:cytochrome c oxidase subunit 3
MATILHEHEVAHHFDDLEQEFESHRFGMWLFLASEIMMFGALLMGGLLILYRHPDAFAQARPHLDWRLGAINTFFLLTGGFTMALAAFYAQKSDQGKVQTNILVSLLMGAAFLVVKTIEYKAKFHHGLLPGHFWHGEGFTSPYAHVFFGYYFVSTGLHALHVIVGMGLMVWCLLVSRKVRFTRGYFTPVEMVGIYWALVDLVWIFLFPLLYLVG